jgi:PTS system galactitol-specific IIA component
MRIIDFLDIEAISIHSPAKTSGEIITDLGTRLYKLGKVKDNFISATLKREADMPTGLPLGGEINAAIPHVDIEYVNHSALALATLEQPVIFRNMVDRDEKVYVRLVIMLALDQPKSQIRMLQEVTKILQNPDVVNRLILAETEDQILTILKTMDEEDLLVHKVQ